MDDNLLRVLGISDNENVITKLLCQCVNASRRQESAQAGGFAQAFVCALIGDDGRRYDKIRAYSHTALRQCGTPDILIKAVEGERIAAIIIEHKLNALEGKDQTEKYASAETRPQVCECVRKLDPKGAPTEWHYVFLTLSESQSPKSAKFSRRVTHGQLLPTLKQFPAQASAVLRKLVDDWIELVENRIKEGPIGLHDLVLKRFMSAAGYEAFEKVFRDHMRYPSGLSPEKFYDYRRQGNPFFACAVSKDAWHFRKKERELPTYIHIEPQFHRSDNTFWVYLHWELDPYETRKEARSKNYPEDLLGDYQRKRRSVQDYLRQKNFRFLRIRGTWNGVGSRKIDITGTTVDDLCSQLYDLMTEIAEAVDDYLRDQGVWR